MGTRKYEVHNLDGSRIDWNNPPRPTTMCAWRDSNGARYKGSFRTLCHLARLNRLAIHKFGAGITVLQPDWNTTVRASAGTHDYDSVWDVWINGVDPWTQQRFYRANGLWGWYRHPPLFGNHYHGFTAVRWHWLTPIVLMWRQHGFKVGKYVDGGWSLFGHGGYSAQVRDFRRHAFGLANQHEPGSDTSWFPAPLRKTIFDLRVYVKRRQS